MEPAPCTMDQHLFSVVLYDIFNMSVSLFAPYQIIKSAEQSIKTYSQNRLSCSSKATNVAKILVVEDNVMYQKILAKQLDILGFTCDIAKDGNQGKALWVAGNYQLILTDCQMPVLDGYQMTMTIRELESQTERKITPIIAVTGCTSHEEISHCITHGMNDCINKPVKLDDLRQLLKKWHVYG